MQRSLSRHLAPRGADRRGFRLIRTAANWLAATNFMPLPCLLCPHRASRSSVRHPATAAATPSPHPMARASRPRALRPSSRSQASAATDVERADLEAVIMGMLEGQFQKPVRVIASAWPAWWVLNITVRPSSRDSRDIRDKMNKAAPTRRLTRQWPFCC
jgi:hypothetical protein